MKKILLFMLVGCLMCTQALASPSAKQTYFKKNFTASTTSNYDPMDVFGILTFLMQYSYETGQYNYEAAGLTWSTMVEAINGNPDSIFTKLKYAFTWEIVGNLRVLTEFNCHYYYNIKFTGIFDGKYFKNLKLLNLENNQITSVNLVNNPNLVTLNCYFNPLTSLDVSKNTNLKALLCMGNQLTSLDVSKNSNLQSLYCDHNNLTSLDVSKNPKLVDLGCDDNQLTSLDVSKNTFLKTLSCSNNQLTSIDISKNSNLQSLYCGHNNLTSLDISKNLNLEMLFCYNNQLTSLDVTKNLLLEILSCSFNNLTSIDISKNPELRSLFCSDNQLTSLDVSKNNKLSGLSCYYNKLTSLDLSKNTKLQDLLCYNNQLKFSTLKGDFSQLYLPIISFNLSPQALLKGGTKGYFELIDLSSEYNINGTLTTFTWYDKATNKEVSVFAANGTFYASPANAGKTLRCKMTNALYPTFTLEYEVTISQTMTQSLSAKKINFSGIPEGFTLTGPEANSSNLEVYPNPVTNVLKITTPSKIESVTVYNYSGREVKRITSVPNKEVNLQDLATGSYILTIKTNQGTVTKKIIKK